MKPLKTSNLNVSDSKISDMLFSKSIVGGWYSSYKAYREYHISIVGGWYRLIESIIYYDCYFLGMTNEHKKLVVEYCEAIINECKKDFTSSEYITEKMRYINSYISELEN